MNRFLFIAALMTLACALMIAWPLLRARLNVARDKLAAACAVLVLTASAAGLYTRWSHWSWQAPVSDGTPQSMISTLVRRVEEQPADLKGWLLLGRSYAVLEQYPLAARAYQRADRLAGGHNAEALEGWAEALTLNNEEELLGRAGRLFEQALALNPASGKALFFSAIAALRRGELPLARERLASLLAHDPPQNVRPIIERQIAALDAQLLAADSPAGASEPRISLHITLAAALAGRARLDAPLFVLARSPGQPGPPLAVRKLTAQLPAEVQLTRADSMLPGRAIAAGQRVEVVARLALSGSPTGAKGDLEGRLSYEVGKEGRRALIIDKITP